MRARVALLSLLALFTVACSGGSDSSSPPSTDAPAVANDATSVSAVEHVDAEADGDADADNETGRSATDVDLGDDPQLDPVERMINGTLHEDLGEFASAFTSADCDVASAMSGATLDPSSLALPLEAEVVADNGDAAIVAVTDADGNRSEVPVGLDGTSWVIDATVCDIVVTTQTRVAQANLRNALVAAKVYYTDEESYSLEPAELAAIEPSLSFGDLEGASTNVIGVLDEHQRILLVTESEFGTWFCVASDAMLATTTFGQGDEFAAVDSFDKCTQPTW